MYKILFTFHIKQLDKNHRKILLQDQLLTDTSGKTLEANLKFV